MPPSDTNVTEGYDSHYSLLKQPKGAKAHIPITSLDDIPDADEAVIFNPDQILPRYLIYIEESKKETSKFRTVLWIDPVLKKNLEYIERIKQHKIDVVTLDTNLDAMEWLSLNANHKLLTAHSLRIISSSSDETGKVEFLIYVSRCSTLPLAPKI